MSKIHYEIVESSTGLSIKSGSFFANIEVEDFKWSELSSLIDEFYQQEELPVEEQSPTYKAYKYGAAPIAITRNSNGNLEYSMVEP